MSSKVVRGSDVAKAQPIHWAKARPPAGDHRSSPDSPSAADHEHVLRQNLEECERRVRQARVEAHREIEAEFQREHAQRLQQLYEAVARSSAEIAGLRDRVRKEAEDDIVRLALAIARKVIQRELQVDKEALLGLVKIVLHKVDARETHHLRVHPAQAAAVTRCMEELQLPKRIEVSADPALEQGAVIFETTRGVLDASVDTQLREIERGFLDVLG